MSNYIAIYSDDYLSHHGILGQKWGVRRYQNADGSLTAAGRAHYGVESIRGKASEAVEKVKTKKAEHDRVKAAKKETNKESKKIDTSSESSESSDSNEETTEKKGLTKGQKVAIAIAATAVTVAAIKMIHDKGGKDFIEDTINTNQTLSNIKRSAAIASEQRSRDKMIKDFDKKYGFNDPEYKRTLERASRSRDRVRLATNGTRTVTTHHNYDADFLAALDKDERKIFRETGYDTTEQVARPRTWARSVMSNKDFQDITDSYMNVKAEEYLRDLGLKTR